jgi:hypothetical protein
MHQERERAPQMGDQLGRQGEFAMGPAMPGLGQMAAALGKDRRVVIKAGHHAGLVEDDLADRHAEAAMLMPVEAEQGGDGAPTSLWTSSTRRAMRQEILTGPERRPRWSVDERRRILGEAGAEGIQVADIARRWGNITRSAHRRAANARFGVARSKRQEAQCALWTR